MATKTEELEFIAKVISNNRVTVPLSITELKGIEEGHYLKLKVIEVIKKKQEEVVACP